MNAKAQFLKDKQLVEWWVSVAHTDNFRRVLIYLTANLAEGSVSAERLLGAMDAFRELEAFADNEERPTPSMPKSGLIHHMPTKHSEDKPSTKA